MTITAFMQKPLHALATAFSRPISKILITEIDKHLSFNLSHFLDYRGLRCQGTASAQVEVALQFVYSPKKLAGDCPTDKDLNGGYREWSLRVDSSYNISLLARGLITTTVAAFVT